MITNSLQEIILHAYQHAEGWKNRLDELGISPHEINGIDDLNRIPVLRKDQLPRLQSNNYPFGGLATVEASQMARIFMSPGPIYDPQASDGDFWRFSEALSAAGFGKGDIVQNTFSYHLSPAGFMFDSALRKLAATVIPAGVGNSELQVQVMKDCKVTGFVGTPSYLKMLLDKAEQMGVNINQDLYLKKAFFTAEMLPLSLRQQFESLGIETFEGYGTADAGCIAFQSGSEPGLEVTPSAIVQICDPESGLPVPSHQEIGEVVITLLDNYYPLIRFGTGDLSRWVEGKMGERIVGVLGRVGDGVKVRGMFVHKQQIDNVIKEFSGIVYYQAIITREENRDQFILKLEADTLSLGEQDSILKRLKDVLRVTPSLVHAESGSIDRNESQLLDQRKWD